MSGESTYVERLGSELVVAGRRLQRQEQRQFARERGRQLAGRRSSHLAGNLRRHAAQALSTVSRRTRLRATFAFCSVALIAALTLAGLGLSAGTQQAYAGWSPTPTQPAAGQIAAAETTCLSGTLDDLAQKLKEAQTHAIPERGAAPIRPSRQSSLVPDITSGEWQRTLSDTRGPYTMLIFQAAAGRARGFCLSKASTVIQATESYEFQAMPVSAGQIHVYYTGEAGQGGNPGEEPYSYINGQAGPGVTSVTLDLEGGEHVQASVENGWFLAWWPGSAQASTAEVQATSGTSTQSLAE